MSLGKADTLLGGASNHGDHPGENIAVPAGVKTTAINLVLASRETL